MATPIPTPDIPGLVVNGSVQMMLDARINGQVVEFVYADTWVDNGIKITVDDAAVVRAEIACGGGVVSGSVHVTAEATAEQVRVACDAVACFYHGEDALKPIRKALRSIYRVLSAELTKGETTNALLATALSPPNPCVPKSTRPKESTD